MDRLETLKLFVRVAELGSFSRAAEEVGRTQSQVSRAIRALEGSLGVQLLQRTTRRVALSSEGERYRAQIVPALSMLASAADDVRAVKGAPTGQLRVSAPVGFGHAMVTPSALTYLDRYPTADLTLTLTDRFVDLVEEGYDMAVRIGDIESTTLRVIRLGTVERWLVGHPDLVSSRGPVERPSALDRWPKVVFSSLRESDHWTFRRGDTVLRVPAAGRFRTNNLLTLQAALRRQLGIAAVPAWAVADSVERGELRRLFADWDVGTSPIHAVMPPGAYVPTRVRTFIEILKSGFTTARPCRPP